MDDLFPTIETIQKTSALAKKIAEAGESAKNRDLGIVASQKHRLKTQYHVSHSGVVYKRRCVGINKALAPKKKASEEPSPDRITDDSMQKTSRKGESDLHYLVPKEHSHAVLLWAHILENGKHAGRDRTYERIKEKISPEGFSKDIVNAWIAKCPTCSVSLSRTGPGSKRKRSEEDVDGHEA